MEVVFILFKSNLPKEDVISNFKARADLYRSVPGLVQKYYIHDDKTGHFGGIHIFDSLESAEAFMSSALVKSIGNVQSSHEPPTIRLFHVDLVLHDRP
ncbi:MAG: YdhR family protein [Methanomassiliicoccales archaeon]|jgi:heme-degrading monooxygenase HmoA|nr:YdhR family protein [Methanomassiliicoccales archaeon]